MKQIFQNTFVSGLVMALAVVVTDVLNTIIAGGAFHWDSVGLAAGIAVAGYVGKYLTGTTNTTLALLGSAIVAVLPMITGTEIDWKLVLVAFAAKFLGLITSGLSLASKKA